MGHLLLHEENIVTGLDALNREAALKKIVDALPAWNLRGIKRQKILDLLILREQIGTTAIGQGIALPHCFSPEIHDPILAFGVSPSGVAYPSLDGRPVHFIFLLILPQNEAAERQKRQILQNIKWILCDRYLQERLKTAHTASEIHQLIAPESRRIPALGILQFSH
jgi:mannitol/fructose-specific phosphotransferase system IIA component (Ntr-type)